MKVLIVCFISILYLPVLIRQNCCLNLHSKLKTKYYLLGIALKGMRSICTKDLVVLALLAFDFSVLLRTYAVYVKSILCL